MTLDFETAKNVDLDDRFPFADTKNVNYPYYRGLTYLAELPTDKPRMIKSHFQYCFLPGDIQERKKGKVQLQLHNKTFEPCHEKTNALVSDQVRHKPGCTATEDG